MGFAWPFGLYDRCRISNTRHLDATFAALLRGSYTHLPLKEQQITWAATFRPTYLVRSDTALCSVVIPVSAVLLLFLPFFFLF
jgi:hypothetical protein